MVCIIVSFSCLFIHLIFISSCLFQLFEQLDHCSNIRVLVLIFVLTLILILILILILLLSCPFSPFPLFVSGSFGVVYGGKCRQKDVAVKMLQKQDFDQKTLAAFRHEVDVM